MMLAVGADPAFGAPVAVVVLGFIIAIGVMVVQRRGGSTPKG